MGGGAGEDEDGTVAGDVGEGENMTTKEKSVKLSKISKTTDVLCERIDTRRGRFLPGLLLLDLGVYQRRWSPLPGAWRRALVRPHDGRLALLLLDGRCRGTGIFRLVFWQWNHLDDTQQVPQFRSQKVETILLHGRHVLEVEGEGYTTNMKDQVFETRILELLLPLWFLELGCPWEERDMFP